MQTISNLFDHWWNTNCFLWRFVLYFIKVDSYKLIFWVWMLSNVVYLIFLFLKLSQILIFPLNKQVVCFTRFFILFLTYPWIFVNAHLRLFWNASRMRVFRSICALNRSLESLVKTTFSLTLFVLFERLLLLENFRVSFLVLNLYWYSFRNWSNKLHFPLFIYILTWFFHIASL